MTAFETFIIERNQILKDIEGFLLMVIKFFSCMRNDFQGVIDLTASLENGRSLVKSFSFIHALYGYPDTGDSTTENITVEKDAIRQLLETTRIRNGGMRFRDFCTAASENNFWEFKLEDMKTLVNTLESLREPAHIFLEMVRDLLDNREEASILSRLYLETLPPTNKLKPEVWAGHKENLKCYGVSLGVRSFVRPLFLYMKLCQLRTLENGQNHVNLDDTTAFKATATNLLQEGDYVYPYNVVNPACDSCTAFFSVYRRVNARKRIKNPDLTNSFGNCAEYDLIRTNNLDYLLGQYTVDGNGQAVMPWHIFKNDCTQHLDAFITLALEGAIAENLEDYCRQRIEAKVLKFIRFGKDTEPQFQLTAKKLRPERKKQT